MNDILNRKRDNIKAELDKLYKQAIEGQLEIDYYYERKMQLLEKVGVDTQEVAEVRYVK